MRHAVRRIRSRGRLYAAGLAAAAVAAWFGGCGDHDERPNIILVVFDTTRFDDWSWLDPSRGVTPTLDSLADVGSRFTRAYTLHPITVPSHAVMFTGREVPWDQTTTSYRERSLFTILRDHGWRTYAFSGNSNLHESRLDALQSVDVTADNLHVRMAAEHVDGILRKYGEYRSDPGTLDPRTRREYERNQRLIATSADVVNEVAIAAVRDHAERFADRPFLLFLNYNDAHDPYFPEEPWDGRFRSPNASDFNGNVRDPSRRRTPVYLPPLRLSQTSEGLEPGDIRRARDLHLGEVAFASDRFGRLLEELRSLGLLESAVIICTSDHGELFGEDGRMGHGGEPIEALMHVPLLMHFSDPALRPDAFDQPVDLRDVKPTLLAYLGIADETSTGRNLMPLIRREVSELPEPAPRGKRFGGQVLPGQDPARTERLIEELKALGYVE